MPVYDCGDPECGQCEREFRRPASGSLPGGGLSESLARNLAKADGWRDADEPLEGRPVWMDYREQAAGILGWAISHAPEIYTEWCDDKPAPPPPAAEPKGDNYGHVYTYDAEGRAATVDGKPSYTAPQPGGAEAKELREAREAFLDLFADARRFETDTDGDETGITCEHSFTVDDLSLRTLIDKLGIPRGEPVYLDEGLYRPLQTEERIQAAIEASFAPPPGDAQEQAS